MCVYCGRKEEDVSFSEHTTRIGRERVRVHPSQRERGIFGDTSLCTRHLRERHHHRIAERYNTSKPYRVDDRALREEEDQEELYHQTFLRPALRRLYSLLLFDAQQTRRRTPSSGAGKCRRKKRSSASDEDAVVVGETALGHRGRGKETARHGTQTRKRRRNTDDDDEKRTRKETY